MKPLVAFSDFVGRTFALWVLVFAVLGYFLPDVFRQVAPYIVWLLAIIMFGMGLTISPGDFREVLTRPLDVLIGVLAQFIIMPLAAVLLTKVVAMPPEIAAGVILVGCCPGGTASNVMTYMARGDTALSVAITSVTTLLAPVVTPFLVSILASAYLDVDFMAMFLSIVQVVIVPLAVGALLQVVLPGFVRRTVPMLPLVSVVGIVLIVAAVVGANQARIAESGLLIVGLVVAHNVFGLALGYLVAKLLGMSEAKRRAVSIEVGMQNSGLGAALATAHFSPLAAVPSAVFSVWHNISGALLANWFRGRPLGPDASELSKAAAPTAGR